MPHITHIPRFHYAELPSTNDTAKELLRKERCVAVTTGFQTKGRGRNGKVWSGQPDENVYCSIGLKHRFDEVFSIQGLVSYQALGCLAAKAAVQEVCKTASNITLARVPQFFLKYPNDVYAQPAPQATTATSTLSSEQAYKVAGILVEHEFAGARCTTTIIGIGINVRQTLFPPEVRHKAASLHMLGADVSVEQVTQALLRYAEFFLKQSPESLFDAWREELNIEGATVQLAGESAWWHVLSLSEDGRLRALNPATGEERMINNGDSITAISRM